MKDSNKQYRDKIIQRAMQETNVKNKQLVEKAFMNAHIPESQWETVAGGTAPLPTSLIKSLNSLKQQSGGSNS